MMQTANSFKEKREKIRDDNSLSEDNKKAAYKKLRDDFQNEVKGILTEEQFTKWQSMKAERKGKRQVHKRR